MVSLWINKTLTINGPNLLSLYSPSTSHFVSLLVSAPFLWKTFSPYIFPLLSWNVQSQEKCNLRTLSHSRCPTNRSKSEGKVFFQCTCKVMQSVFVRGLSHCPFAVEVADLSRLFVQFFCFFTLLWLTMTAENILEENVVTHSNLALEITILIGLSRPHLKKRAGVIVLFLRLYVSKSHPDQPFHIVLNLFLYMFLNGFPFNHGLIQSRLSL